MLTCGHHQASARPIQTACEQAGMGDGFMKVSHNGFLVAHNTGFQRLFFFLSILIVRGEATTARREAGAFSKSWARFISSYAFRDRNSRARVASHVICRSVCPPAKCKPSLSLFFIIFFHHDKWDSINTRGNRQVAKNGTGGPLVVTTSGDWRFA